MTDTSSISQQLDEARQFLQDQGVIEPKMAIILGSGLGGFGDEVEDPVAISYGDIPHFAATTVKGHAGKLIFGRVGDLPVVCQQGRFHYYEGHPMSKVVFPARLMAYLGVKAALVTNAAGAVNQSLVPGDLMLIRDHINFLGTNPLVGPHDESMGERFPDMSQAYHPGLRKIAREIAGNQKISLRDGIYLANSGPSYETPAEIRLYRSWGADAVGMSTVPEVIVFNQMGVVVLGISCITNMAAGVLDQPLSHAEVIELTQTVEKDFVAYVKALLKQLSTSEHLG